MAGATGAMEGAITGARAGAMLGPRAVEEAEADMTGAETEATGRFPGAGEGGVQPIINWNYPINLCLRCNGCLGRLVAKDRVFAEAIIAGSLPTRWLVEAHFTVSQDLVVCGTQCAV